MFPVPMVTRIKWPVAHPDATGEINPTASRSGAIG